MPELEVRLFGAFQVTVHGQPVTTLGAPRLQALLAWLLLHRDCPQPRRQVAFALWPDSDEAQALTNLRRELHHLRRAWPAIDQCLEVNALTLHWTPDGPSGLDVAAFEQASRSVLTGAARDWNELERAAGLYPAALLPGLDDEWIDAHRQRWHDRMVAVLEALLDDDAPTSGAVRYAQRLVALEPYRDSAHARLMALHLDAGDPGAARHAYHECVRVLAAELGAAPGPLVQAAFHRLEQQGEQAPPAPPGPGEPPLVGRRAEWGQVLEAWQAASSGPPRALLITGEAGIGKTRLAEALLTFATAQGVRTARTRSYAAEGRLAYAPVVEWLRSPALYGALASLALPWRREVARLLPELTPESARNRAERHSEGWQRPQLFESLARACLGSGALLLLLDDLQWCDRDTLEWLHFLLRFEAHSPLLLVFTLRREEQDRTPAVRSFLQILQQRGLLNRVELGALSSAETAQLAEALRPGTLSPGAQSQLYRATEGHPLFIVEALRAGVALDGPEGAAFPPSPRVQAVIAARLEQLSGDARGVAQLAATVGRAFDTRILRDAGELDEDSLAGALDELWRREIIREQPGSGAYDFTHDRLREGAYDALSPARRRLLHRRVARALETRHATDLGAVAAQLAAHLEQAGEPEAAVTAYLQAAERANSVSASQEAMLQIQQALRLILALPDSAERGHAELAAHNMMAAALTALKGFTPPELEHTLDRALALAEQLGDSVAVTRSLWGMFSLQIVRGNVRGARELAERAMRLAGDDTGLLTDSHQALGGGNLTEGRLAAAAEHFEQARRLYAEHRHRRVLFGANVGVFTLAWGAHGLWLQGRVLEAREYVAQAAAIAEELGHPFTQMQARAYRSISHQLEGDLDAAWNAAEAAVEGCERSNIAYYREWGVIVGGWVQARRGEPEAGLRRIRRGLDALQRLDAALRLPYYLSLLAEVHLQLNRPEAARAALDVAQSVAGQNRDLWYLPEVFRLRGLTELNRAEGFFREALALARSQGAVSLELRAATSLAAHLEAAGHPREGAVVLEPVVAVFPAALVTPDLMRARALLTTLT
ncbi:AAA family ATPase [Deinococcus sp. KSM4-11]|uniref:ATP-binding protein n=1 Tax=Deinococcus sp. KSM4-11 TaxID=2568654 RepID=UPI001454D295|nr:AAA family ATPase [Deinococcus sp. KSM4-11]